MFGKVESKFITNVYCGVLFDFFFCVSYVLFNVISGVL